MDWKEQIVLQFKNIIIPRDVISHAMQNVINEMTNNFIKYGIKKEATSDFYTFIEVEGFFKINVKQEDRKKVTFSLEYLHDKTYLPITITLKVIDGKYVIRYIDVNRIDSDVIKDTNCYNYVTLKQIPNYLRCIDHTTIDEIFKDLIILNELRMGKLSVFPL